MDDRTNFVPRHRGQYLLPCHGLFNRLLRLAGRRPPKPCIRDVQLDCECTHLQLLTDVFRVRNIIEEQLDDPTRAALGNQEETYIAVLAPGGYEFACAVLAILALGAAVVPMSVILPVREAEYFVNKSKATAVLVASSAVELGYSLQANITSTTNPRFRSIPILPYLFAPALEPCDIILSSNKYLDDNAPGVVIFTSGTTGPPKGSVMRRAYTFDTALAIADHYALNESDSILHLLPVHHATGIGIMFFPFLISGCLIEFRGGTFDETWLWERWRQGAKIPNKRITFFSGVPTMYMRMQRYYQRKLRPLEERMRKEYVEGARQFRACLCGTSALPGPINEFWTDLLQKRILQRYGATEIGAVFKVLVSDDQVPDGTVGEQVPGVELKLNQDREGELLVKSPWMFSKYLGDPEATAGAHDKDGFYKTGDIVRREGKYYWIVGRASLDIIKSGGYKISALDVEREVLSLPYVSEVMVVGVEDEEFGQRVAALVSLQNEELTGQWRKAHSRDGTLLTLESFRWDLRSRLAGYKMPTLLRVMQGELPKTGTGKVMKKTLGPEMFPPNYASLPHVQKLNVEGRYKTSARL
ncbi:MAG: hypothetical protein M1821_005152 [Bathelium mastoideum]|nr:MAG: hypothetical protein M1821_005152 [Bathelium mastoideum]KAI9677804.1 MAG: hypothetical protein M1822_008116 [Bathelium mastoideum]